MGMDMMSSMTNLFSIQFLNTSTNRVGKNGSHTQRFAHYAKFSWFKIHVPKDETAPNLAQDISKVSGCSIQKIETPIVHPTDLMV